LEAGLEPPRLTLDLVVGEPDVIASRLSFSGPGLSVWLRREERRNLIFERGTVRSNRTTSSTWAKDTAMLQGS